MKQEKKHISKKVAQVSGKESAATPSSELVDRFVDEYISLLDPDELSYAISLVNSQSKNSKY